MRDLLHTTGDVMEEFINAVFSYQYYWEALAALALWLYLLKD